MPSALAAQVFVGEEGVYARGPTLRGGIAAPQIAALPSAAARRGASCCLCQAAAEQGAAEKGGVVVAKSVVDVLPSAEGVGGASGVGESNVLAANDDVQGVADAAKPDCAAVVRGVLAARAKAAAGAGVVETTPEALHAQKGRPLRIRGLRERGERRAAEDASPVLAALKRTPGGAEEFCGLSPLSVEAKGAGGRAVAVDAQVAAAVAAGEAAAAAESGNRRKSGRRQRDANPRET